MHQDNITVPHLFHDLIDNLGLVLQLPVQGINVGKGNRKMNLSKKV